METNRAKKLAVTALAALMACAGARADDGLHGVKQLCDHPAVIVARRGVPADPNTNFYLHPARLSWSLVRPDSEGEHPAVLVAHHAPGPGIDPNLFIPGHPAGGWSKGSPSK